ncbi:MAG: nucleotidyltransferase domain-containing protein [Candidatus Woesearchaeota archaeon]|jgi:tRNA nucleotidyltransferase (CCA-adding enzyme)
MTKKKNKNTKPSTINLKKNKLLIKKITKKNQTLKITKITPKTKTTSKVTKLLTLIKEQKELTKPDDKIIIKINLFVEKINFALKKNKINATASIGGSVAKGTFIKGNFDADIFVRFDKKYRGEKISDILEKILIDLKLKIIRVHGSRDYFQIKEEFTYEIVPVINVTDYKDAENVADMSPLHVIYFNKQAKKIKNLREEIRVTKLFMKSARVYGAESYIKGFSGHVVDLLVIKYSSFLNLIKAASKWKEETIIDIEHHHIDAKMSLNSSKISGPLIIVDPIQKNRNASAAASKECYNMFKERCISFLKNANTEYFELPNFKKIIEQKIAQTKNANIFLIEIMPLEGKKDVVGSKVLKIKEYLEQKANDQEFIILWSDWLFQENNSQICIAFEKKIYPPTRIIKGPPLIMKDAVIDFKKSHSNTFNKGENIYAKDPRKFLFVDKFLTEQIKEKYVQEKCKKISFNNQPK